jgi:DNA-binding PadR family transcriptional regulator
MWKNEIDIVILGSMMNGPMHGYQLKQYIQGDYFKHFVSISTGSLYTRLSKFEADGLIEGKREQQDKVPDKKVFSITEAGKRRLVELVVSPISISGVLLSDVNDFIIHALFFDYLSKEQRIGFIMPFYGYVRDQLKHADVTRDSFSSHGITFKDLQVLTFGMGRDVLKDVARYLEDLMEIP